MTTFMRSFGMKGMKGRSGQSDVSVLNVSVDSTKAKKFEDIVKTET